MRFYGKGGASRLMRLFAPRALPALAVSLSLTTAPVFAAAIDYTGGPGSNKDLSDPQNYSPVGAPTSGDTVTFNADGVVDNTGGSYELTGLGVGNSVSIGTMNFTTPGTFTIGGNSPSTATLSIGSGGVTGSATSSLIIKSGGAVIIDGGDLSFANISLETSSALMFNSGSQLGGLVGSFNNEGIVTFSSNTVAGRGLPDILYQGE